SRPFACLVLLLHKIFDNARRSYSSLDELKISLFKYIFGFYNSIRPHSNNGGLSPDDFENL
ncbi:MAG: IS3 family transposase, partial [Lachnospiraceae bacterium]|nr:IS3 family transposase [Lachnospiraceae bacterium]